MFFCDKCGLCCMNLLNSPVYKTIDRGDGICMHFDMETHLCRIYEQRPVICNVDEIYDIYYSKTMAREEYYRINREACNLLKQRKTSV